MKGKHDPYCKSYYPALTDPDTCTWCYVIREVRTDEYLKAWNEGFGIGFEEGKQKILDAMPQDSIESGIKKWEEDVDVAYWQGYNNAMIEMNQQESEGTQ